MKRLTLLLTVLLWAMTGYAVRAQDVAGASDLQVALENNRTNQSSTWVNPDTGTSGTVTPVRTFENARGEPCREFQQPIVIGGREEQGYGIACRQPDGTWRIVAGDGEPTSSPPAEKHTTVYVRDPGYYYGPYGYYAPWGYGYPYWYPFSFSFGYVYRDGGHHHGGHHGGYYGGHHRHDYGSGHYRGGYRGGHRR